MYIWFTAQRLSIFGKQLSTQSLSSRPDFYLSSAIPMSSYSVFLFQKLNPSLVYHTFSLGSGFTTCTISAHTCLLFCRFWLSSDVLSLFFLISDVVCLLGEQHTEHKRGINTCLITICVVQHSSFHLYTYLVNIMLPSALNDELSTSLYDIENSIRHWPDKMHGPCTVNHWTIQTRTCLQYNNRPSLTHLLQHMYRRLHVYQ